MKMICSYFLGLVGKDMIFRNGSNDKSKHLNKKK